MTRSSAARSAALATAPAGPQHWTGGIVYLRGFRLGDKPLRVAAWMTADLSILDAAIVEGNGPSLLRRMLDELMISVPERLRPSELRVWPTARAPFRALEFPTVKIQRDGMLWVVVEDEACAARYPYELWIRNHKEGGPGRPYILEPGAHEDAERRLAEMVAPLYWPLSDARKIAPCSEAPRARRLRGRSGGRDSR